MKFLNKLERKYGRYAIKNLVMYLVIMNAIAFLLSYQSSAFLDKLQLVPQLVLKGQVWRLVTYIFIPQDTSNPIFIIFVLYMLYMIGSGLEREWGSFKFNVYYLIGMLGTTIAVFISGSGGTGYYLNLSLFLAFAYIYPDFQILIFFILPVKMKYLGWLDAIFLAISFLSGSLSDKLAIIAALINFVLFFGKDIIYFLKNNKQTYKRRRMHTVSKYEKQATYHRCTVCGITEKDDKNMEFRYCSTCEGRYEYCMVHLKQHEHIKKVIQVDFTRK
jgi:membrane associated rhomboid family serine protease